MVEVKKFASALTLIGILSLGFTTPSFAEEGNKESNEENVDEAVLLKVHDIIPTKDNDNKTTGCEFKTTIYNRSNANVNEIDFTLKWSDESIKFQPKKDVNPEFEVYNEPDIEANIKIPSLQAFRQKTIKSQVSSSQCFLLMKSPEMLINNCSVQDRKSQLSCQALFRFVPSIDPQYYTEFKPISVNEQATIEMAQKEADRKDISDLFNQIETDINKMSRILSK